MKRFLLLPLSALVFAVAYACTDSTAPANSHALLTAKNPAPTVGDPPPPPVDVAISVTINSPGQAVFTGVFFSKGILDEVGTPFPTFDGTAWLRFDNDNKQPGLGGTASANARFMVKGDDRDCLVDPSTCPTGKGTLTIEGVAYTIVSVQSFSRFTSCETGVEAEPCAKIHFTVTCLSEPITVDCNGTTPHSADLFAFDKETCLKNLEGFDFVCRFPPPDSSEG
jgi:hypothetical protein